MGIALLSLVGALAPVVFMLHFVYVRDKYQREPLHLVLRVYLISFLAVVPAVIVEVAGQASLSASHSAPLLQTALLAFLVVGVAEEGTKYLFLRRFAFSRAEFDEPYDGIVYAVAVSLGFATVENLAYVFGAAALDQRLAVIVMRGLLSVPGHALWGVVMGFYVGHAKFAPNAARRERLLRTGLLLPVFSHGLYDFSLMAATEGIGGPAAVGAFTVIFALTVLMSWVIGVRLISRTQAESPFRRPNPLVRPLAAINPAYKFCTQCGARVTHTDRFCRQCGANWTPAGPPTAPTLG